MRRKPTRRRPTLGNPHAAHSRGAQAGRRIKAAARPHFSRPAVPLARSQAGAILRRQSRSRAPGAPHRTDSAARPKPPKAHGRRWEMDLPRRLATANGKHNGTHTNGAHTKGHARTAPQTARRSNGKRLASGQRRLRLSDRQALDSSLGQRNGHSNGAKPAAGKPKVTGRASSSTSRTASGPRRTPAGYAALVAQHAAKPALTAGTRAGNSKRFGFTRPAQAQAGDEEARMSPEESSLHPLSRKVIVAIDGPAGRARAPSPAISPSILAC